MEVLMPIITISRQFGAGGTTLARLVANRLGYKLVYDEIVDTLAQKANISIEGVISFESEGIDVFDPEAGFFSPKRFIDHIFDSKRKYMDGQTYVQLLKEIIPGIVSKGDMIVLGRGAQFILKDHPGAIHVLCVADLPDRIGFMQQRYNLSAADAEAAVLRQSKRRAKLMKLFHHEDYDQPFNYDMVLNMSKIDMDTAVALVIKLAE
jgi:cytidylate kinase